MNSLSCGVVGVGASRIFSGCYFDAFEGIARSSRPKAGVALCFSRIARWRKDGPAREADTIETLERLLRSREPRNDRIDFHTIL